MAATRTAADCRLPGQSKGMDSSHSSDFLLHFSGARAEAGWIRSIWSKERENKFQQDFAAVKA